MVLTSLCMYVSGYPEKELWSKQNSNFDDRRNGCISSTICVANSLNFAFEETYIY